METLLKLQTMSVALISINFVGTMQLFGEDVPVPTSTLNTCRKYQIPALGYTTWQVEGEQLEEILEKALELGYRHIDTAHIYGNEEVVGKVLKRWMSLGLLKREDIYLAAKLPFFANHPGGVSKYLKKSLENLQVEYVDIYYVHTPFGIKVDEEKLYSKDPYEDFEIDYTTDINAVWKEMEKQVDAGLTKAIGLANFNKTQIQRILDNCRIKPSALQIELHLYLQQYDLVDFCHRNNILVTAAGPLGARSSNDFNVTTMPGDLPDILYNSEVRILGKKYKMNVAQVSLRYDFQRGIIPIVRTRTERRLGRFLSMFNFELTDDEIKKLKSLDANIRYLDFKSLKGIEKHPEYPF